MTNNLSENTVVKNVAENLDENLGSEKAKTKKKKIKANVRNRIMKIRDGAVYNSMISVTDELLQNSKRANATKIDVYLDENKMIIQDNGEGCKNPDDLFTFDVSGFGYGFGEGFSSTYLIGDKITVKSKDWQAVLRLKDIIDGKIALESEDELDYDYLDGLPYYNGFYVELEGERIEEHFRALRKNILSIASIDKEAQYIFNNEIVAKKELLEFENPQDYPVTTRFSNRNMEGIIGVSNNSFTYTKIFFESREVTEIYTPHIEAIVSIKNPKYVTLKAPDRKDIIYDAKRTKFLADIEKIAKNALLSEIKSADNDFINSLSSAIDKLLEVKEYIKFLTLDADDLKISLQPSLTNDTFDNSYFDNSFDNYSEDNSFDNYSEDNSTVNTNNVNGNIPLGLLAEVGQLAKAVQLNEKLQVSDVSHTHTIRNENDKEFSSFVKKDDNSKLNLVKKGDVSALSLKELKKKNNIVWVGSNELEEYKSIMESFEYYGVYTFKSPNVLYDKALREIGITHISDINERGIQKDYKVSNITLKTKKEERALELLAVIEKLFNTGSIFKIANIDMITSVYNKDKRIFKNKLLVEGYTDHFNIYLNRKSINCSIINATNLNNPKIALQDIKFLFANVELIAHELAHFLYGTKDNTIEHHEKTLEIITKISRAISL